jgi:hypothetical protein
VRPVQRRARSLRLLERLSVSTQVLHEYPQGGPSRADRLPFNRPSGRAVADVARRTAGRERVAASGATCGCGNWPSRSADLGLFIMRLLLFGSAASCSL